MLKDWNFWLSIITVIAAILALLLSVWQMQLSNKQQLFSRRLDVYMIVNGLVKLYGEHRTLLERRRENEPEFAMNMIFVWLTNNTYMEQQAEAIKHPLEKPYHQNFLKKREELRSLATEIKFIFTGKEADWYADFISSYEQMLFKMYQYQISIDHMHKENEKHPATIEELQAKFPEEKSLREELYVAIENLRESYAKVIDEKVDKKIRKQLTLI